MIQHPHREHAVKTGETGGDIEGLLVQIQAAKKEAEDERDRWQKASEEAEAVRQTLRQELVEVERRERDLKRKYRDRLEEACNRTGGPAPALHEIAEDGASLRPDTVLQDALPVTLQSEYPVPVISADGEYQGTLSKDDMVGILARSNAVHR